MVLKLRPIKRETPICQARDELERDDTRRVTRPDVVRRDVARNQHDGPRGRVQSLTLAEDAGGVSPGRPSREEDVARPAAEGGPAERPESPPHDLVDRSSEVQPRRRRRGQSLEVDDPLPESFQRDRHTTGTGAVDVRADWRTRRALDEHDLLDVPIVARVARHSRGVVVTADDLCLVQEALMPGWP